MFPLSEPELQDSSRSNPGTIPTRVALCLKQRCKPLPHDEKETGQSNDMKADKPAMAGNQPFNNALREIKTYHGLHPLSDSSSLTPTSISNVSWIRSTWPLQKTKGLCGPASGVVDRILLEPMFIASLI